MNEEPAVIFGRLGAAGPPDRAEALFGTACVLGGSIAGLLAARVLADYAERVVVVEREAVGHQAGPRAGVPQGRHVHALLPAGRSWMERWLPGLTGEMEDGGAILAGDEQLIKYLDGRPRVRTGDHELLLASRPFLEASVRARVLALPNIVLLQSQATGLEYRGDAVRGVRHRAGDGAADMLSADIVVDAMGRASKLSDWLSADGFDRPLLQRLPTAINYTTAVFERPQRPEELELIGSIAQLEPPYAADGVSVAAVTAIENNQWILLLMGYDDARPARTADAFRATCAKLPPLFAEVASNPLAGQIATYYQAESRRRDFAGRKHLPAGLVSVGDAVASFNPIYGQGMSSAALHASCLAEYLKAGPDVTLPATAFFGMQQVVVDAAWAISAGSDAARLDALSGADLPEAVSYERWAMDQIMRATLVDVEVCRAFENVAYMVAHPGVLADPALVERAVSANQQGVS